MTSDREHREVLERFIVDNHDLEKLELLVNQFNIFEAIGVTRQELRHSDFLAFLLDPSQSHQLSDRFLKRFLKRVLVEAEIPTVSAIEIDVANLQDAEVRREWRNIDILIYSRSNHLIVAIENKVGAGEHSNQLQRYKSTIQNDFSNCQAVLIFLSPEGTPPLDADWIPHSYAQIADLVDLICDSYKTTLGLDVHTVMAHYSSLIRRHVVSSSDIAELCQKIYRQHRQALDLIYEHRPDLQSELSAFLQDLLTQSVEKYSLVPDKQSKEWICFALAEWDQFPFQITCQDWTSSGRALLFVWCNFSDKLNLELIIGPTSSEIKHDIYHVLEKIQCFPLRKVRSLNPRYSAVYRQTVLTQVDYEQMNLEELQQQIQLKWHDFLTKVVPVTRQGIASGLGDLQSNTIE